MHTKKIFNKFNKQSFRFFIQIGLVVVLLASVLLGVGYANLKIVATRKQQEAASWIEDNGGSFHCVRDDRIHASTFAYFLPRHLIESLGEHYFVTIYQVTLTNCNVENIENLRCLTQLRKLRLRGTRLSEVGTLTEFKRLEELDLGNTPIMDIAELGELNDLLYLSIDGTNVRQIDSLATVKTLSRLVIPAEVSREQIERLKTALPRCTIETRTLEINEDK